MRTLILTTFILAFGVAGLGVSHAISNDGYFIYDFGEDASITISDPHNTISEIDTWIQNEPQGTAVFFKIIFPIDYEVEPELLVELVDPDLPEMQKYLVNLDDLLKIYPESESPPPTLPPASGSDTSSEEKPEEETLDPETLEKLKQCHSGFGRSKVIQGAEYSVNWEEFADYYLYTTMDKRHKIDQFCRAQMIVNQTVMEMYPGLILDDEYEPRPGLDESRGFAGTKTATADEIEKQAQRASEYMCDEENLHLKLCTAYMELTGDNRGNPEIINNNELYNDYVSALAASVQTDADKERAYEKAREAMCIYLDQYGHYIRDGVPNEKFPLWLYHCLG